MEQLVDRILKIRWEIKFGVLLGTLVAVTGANYLLFVTDLDADISRQDVQIRKLEDDLIQKQAITNNLDEYRRQKDQLEQRLADALTELPNDANIDDLLTQLNEVGVRAGLELASVEPGAEASEGSFYSKIPVKLSIVGNYHEIASFLDSVGKLKRIVNVSDISLKSPVKQGDKVILKGDCLATTFRFIAKAATARKQGGPR